ncbi:LytR/AlgR family response regulator transcription factor [Hydrogenophaga sp.]|uniref:LytR/AlgR family response regulator transcription factor n=1 Tax=Hydrogenophaga sp. TaxID=1904254 RepID=UPI00356731C0
MNPTALIAEDEPLLATALQTELARVWPELQVVAVVGDGASAIDQALALRPDVLFLDIRMPGLSGLAAAADLADAWPLDTPFPALVFVTAYDQYAVQAFEAQAVDYVLKPVEPERLRRSVQKIQQVLAQRTLGTVDQAPLDRALAQLRVLLAVATPATVEPLQVIQASVGNSIQMVPVQSVLYFEAADKYVRVLTAEREFLIRTPLRELLPRLDAALFWRIHRGTVVHATAIENVHREESGKLSLRLRGRPETLTVSRLYAQRFKAM